MAARITLLLVFWAGMLFGGQATRKYTYELRKGDVVSEVSRLYTGKASNWRKPGVQVINKRTGRVYPKSEKRYKRLYPGDKVTIAKALVPTTTISTDGKSLDEICAQYATRDCTFRLALLNKLTSHTNLPPTLEVPTWFEPAPKPQAPPAPAAPVAKAPEPQPRQVTPVPWYRTPGIWWFLFFFLVIVAVVALLARRMETRTFLSDYFARFRRRRTQDPQDTQNTFTRDPRIREIPLQDPLIQEIIAELDRKGEVGYFISEHGHRHARVMDIVFREDSYASILEAINTVYAKRNLTVNFQPVSARRLVLEHPV